MSVLEQTIPFVSLESEVGSNFHIRPLRPYVDPEELQEGPHRHSFQELLWVRDGSGRQRIDDDILEIQAGTFYLIAKGQVHYFIQGIDLKGYILRFSDDFLPDEITTAGWDYRMTLFSHFSFHQMLSPHPEDIEAFQLVMDRMWDEIQADGFGKNHILRHLLSILLILLERSRLKLPQQHKTYDSNLHIFQNFISLLENTFREEHSVDFYAKSVHLTPRQLSDIVKSCTGKTAKTLILERVILEARRHLQHTNSSVKEIAYALGFKDPSYFSKVFKLMTGDSPNNYKRSP